MSGVQDTHLHRTMRLLDTKTLDILEFNGDEVPPYAILSHRWGDNEVTFQDMQNRAGPIDSEGYEKLESFCVIARSSGFKWAWMDTCCIDKSSSAELTESINSMHRWYQKSVRCLVYLNDVRRDNLRSGSASAEKEFMASSWFTRGWTLQELIAPSVVLFYNRYWVSLGYKEDLGPILSRATLISEEVLAGKTALDECSIAQRMTWAAQRTTTRVEDRAYSLLGIFNVYMPIEYGERERAFQRLQEEIINQSEDHSLFAWRDTNFGKPILAPSPSCFTNMDKVTRLYPTKDTSQGYRLGNAGLSIRLQLIPWSMNTYLAPIRCKYTSANPDLPRLQSFRGYDRVCLFLQQTNHDGQFIRVSVNSQDLVVISGDEVARVREKYGLPDSEILIRRLDTASYIKPSSPSFYGFTFSFKHDKMFHPGPVPSTSDALPYHKWRPAEPIFKIRNGEHHVAGVFRLSGFSTGLFMYLGFDPNFAPLCLVTFRSPQSRHFTLLPRDFEDLGEEDASKLLDLTWLRTEIARDTQSTDTRLAFKGDRRTKTEVECRSLSLIVTFEWMHSDLVGKHAWRVTFRRLERPQSRAPSPLLGHLKEPEVVPASLPSSLVVEDDDDNVRIRGVTQRSHEADYREPGWSLHGADPTSDQDNIVVRREEMRSYEIPERLRRVQILQKPLSPPSLTQLPRIVVPDDEDNIIVRRVVRPPYVSGTLHLSDDDVPRRNRLNPDQGPFRRRAHSRGI